MTNEQTHTMLPCLGKETTIPLLPCSSYDETLKFYQGLGFDVAHEQQEPYLYIAVTKGAIHLHFTGSLGVYQAKNPFGSCLIFVDEVNRYHHSFAAALRAVYGKVPTANLPRLTRLRMGQTRFKLFDPTGNVLIFINHNELEMVYETDEQSRSELEEALNNANFLRDTYANDKAAAKVLDRALDKNKAGTIIDRARVLAARAELAVALGDDARSQQLQSELQQLPLSDEECSRFCDELQAAEALKAWLTSV